MTYFDNNATTELLNEVREAIKQVLSLGPSNPSSAHYAGNIARKYIQNSRDILASLIGCTSENIIFTSGGTESNNLILHSFSKKQPSPIVVSSVEHESIRKTSNLIKNNGVQVIEIPVDRNGVVDLDILNVKISSATSLVSIQWFNNETGVIQPIEEIGNICKSKGIPFHTDAAQAVGKIPIDIRSLPIDYMTFTGHKFHAPKGIGVLYKSSNSSLTPMFGGGMQEFGLRPGTENLIGIVGLGKAAEIRMLRLNEIRLKLLSFREKFETILNDICPEIKINGQNTSRACNTSNIQFSEVDGEALLAQLNALDIYCSQGSACTSRIPEPSHVLKAMGLSSEQAFSSIRFSFSELNTHDEIEKAAFKIGDTYKNLRKTMKRITK